MAVYGNYNYITEFQGNPENNKEFVEILKDLDEICNLYVEKVKRLANYMNRILLLKSVNNISKYKKVVNEIDGISGDYNKWLKTYQKI